ncbi:MAG: sigma-54-dependent Fis family transcriptional regulator [Bacteroidales bacterium]|nr:sigma-54-dependent Fis family transcriptional regulator [Bacteroidales bacterium]
MKKNILIVDDNLTICLMLKSWLVKNNYNVETTSSAQEAKQMVKDIPFDLILSDIRMPDVDGISFLNWTKKYDSDIQVIMMTGYAEIESVVESMKSGATDYISKPIDPEILFSKIEEAFQVQENIKKNNQFPNDFLIPPGNEYKQLHEQLHLIAENNDHLLIIGDRGTGKHSSVKLIFEKGIHRSQPLVILDASDLISTQSDNNEYESVLIKKIKVAKGGLFYIRDIDKLNLFLQNELLTVLTKQSRDENFTQVILSSQQSLEELQNTLIPKLYNVLQKNVVILPPLKGKSEQILSFSQHFLEFANFALNKQLKGIDSEMQKEFISYNWPGNIQELKNTIIKAALLTEGDVITTEIAEELFGGIKYEREETNTININSLRKENYEKEKIYQALTLAKGNKTMAASILNIDRKTLYNKIKLYSVTT